MSALCARFFIASPDQIQSGQEKIEKFLTTCFACNWVHDVYIAVNPQRDHGNTPSFLASLEVPEGKRLIAFPVTPWGRYVEALNALAARAALDGHRKAMFVNTEHLPTDVNIGELDQHLQNDTLVVGGYLEGFHEFTTGPQEMNGMRVPADAFMLMNLEVFNLIGFVSVSEALWIPCLDSAMVGTPDDPGMAEAGIKEVPTFSLIQKVLGRENARVKMVHVTGAQRNAEGISGKRKQMDEYKRASALKRADIQMQKLGIPYGIVEHIETASSQ